MWSLIAWLDLYELHSLVNARCHNPRKSWSFPIVSRLTSSPLSFAFSTCLPRGSFFKTTFQLASQGLSTKNTYSMCVGKKCSKNVNISMKFTNVNLYSLLFLPFVVGFDPIVKWYNDIGCSIIQFQHIPSLFHNSIPTYSKFVLIIHCSMVNLKIFILCAKFNWFIHCVPFNHATFWPCHVVGITFEWLYLFFPWGTSTKYA
jgi:hypothetical protein